MDAPAASRSSFGIRVLRGVGVFVLTAALGIAGTVGTASLAEANNWCCVHGWALAHGTGVIVLMTWSLPGYHLVTLAGARLKLLPPEGRFGLLPHLSFVAAALGSLFLTEQFMWLGLAAGLVTVFLYAKGSTLARPAGLGLVGLLVSTLCISQWLYMKWALAAIR